MSRFHRTRTLGAAHKLAARGNTPGAIETLRRANRKHPHGDLERALVDLLLQSKPAAAKAGHDLPAANDPAGDHPPTLPAGRIPEINARDLNAQTLRTAINEAGYLIVRGFFDSGDTAELRECIDAALGARVDAEQLDAPPTDDPWYYPSPHFPGTHVAFSKLKQQKHYARTGSIMVIDSPRGAFRVLELYRKYGLKTLLDNYFREPAVLATRKWVFRLIEPRDLGHGIGGGWHQDGRFMGEGIVALNMWVALTECGEGTDAPGITLLPRRIAQILETGTRGANIDWVVAGALVEELAADAPIVSPHFKEGDALFFDHFSLHRSGHEPGLTRNRYALESWFYANTASANNAVIDLH
ncbi:MAG: hypothetical protein NXI15_16350 [Gammaproteobacteria bacterium]|nr:hypothetical protein [Gammaproteobacteria bacterium]